MILRMEAWLPHCPRNRSHSLTTVKKGRVTIPMMIKTEAARHYEKALTKDLLKFQETVLEFRKVWDPTSQALVAHWTYYSPTLLTKKGTISQNSTDLDAHKVMQDTVMAFVGIDDAYICQDFREKLHSSREGFQLTLENVSIRSLTAEGDLLQ